MKTAILIDGGFYRQRALLIYGKKNPQDRAKEMYDYCFEHLGKNDSMYRIFYYDCPPISKKLSHPLTGIEQDYSTTSTYKWFQDFINCMTSKRHVALRLGRLSEEHAGFILPTSTIKRLYEGTIKFDDLTPSDFKLDVKQKGVDMKIGIDIASLAYKKQVERIVLIAGDSDFVPASKLARREGIDFILDPMWNHINPDLNEHIDGLITHATKPTNA